MGTSPSLPSRWKLRDIILLRLHHLLSKRQECLETWLVHSFQKHDPTNSGYVSLDILYFIAESVEINQIRREDCNRIGKLFDFDENGNFYYMTFIWYILPPGKMFIKEEKTIGSHGIFQISKGSWDVGQFPITIKKIQIDLNNLYLVDDTRRDISLLATLSYPNLLRYIGSDINDFSFFLCQEWSEASSLRTILKAFGRMSEPTIRRYMIQVIDGVEYLHSFDILHKNIHGESVYIDTAGLVKLGEFNIGSILRTMSSTTDIYSESIYEIYKPPESVSSKWGKKADIWTIGLLALEMACGTAFLKLPPSKIPPIPEKISPAFRAFFAHCFEIDPKNRATAQDLSLHPFFQMDPAEETNRMLTDVCISLDMTMKRLKETIPSRFEY